MYFVYILRSGVDGSKYIGACKNLKKRINEHNLGKTRYTKSKVPFKLVWFSCFIDKEKAYNFERYLKSGSGYAFTNKRLS